MNPADAFDVRQAFEFLDAEKDDVITLDGLETILLGLGFADRVDRLRLERQLSEAATGASDAAAIPLEIVLKIIETHYPRLRDRAALLDESFRLVDAEGKGHIDAADVVRLARDAGQSLSLRQGGQIVRHGAAAAGADHMDRRDFHRIFAPPGP